MIRSASVTVGNSVRSSHKRDTNNPAAGLNGCMVFEVERAREFAPVKNRTGVDSVDTARELLVRNSVEL